MIKCIIIDDEQLARTLLEGYIEKLPHLVLIGSCKSSMEALGVLHKEEVDLMLLDIQMPDLTGIEFLKTLNRKPKVIFTTAYKEYAIEGYELDVVDYLLKPISFERFVLGVNKAIKSINLRKQIPTNATIGKSDEKDKTNFILLKADHKTYKINYNDISYIEGLREYVTFYTTQRKIIVLESLKKLEETLPKDNFMRVHKSYIINTHKVNAFSANKINIEDNCIPIGKSYIEDVKSKLVSR